MNEQPKGPGVWFMLAPIACCGIPLLLAAGFLSGFGAWLADGGIPIIVGVAIAALAFVYAWKRLGRPSGGRPAAADKIALSTGRASTEKERSPGP